MESVAEALLEAIRSVTAQNAGTSSTGAAAIHSDPAHVQHDSLCNRVSAISFV